MHGNVRRVTVIQRESDRGNRQATTVYRKSEKGGGKASTWSRPLERGVRRLEKAQVVFGQEVRRQHDEANRRRSDGWFWEGPAIFAYSGRKALNEVRKGPLFRLILPKM